MPARHRTVTAAGGLNGPDDRTPIVRDPDYWWCQIWRLSVTQRQPCPHLPVDGFPEAG